MLKKSQEVKIYTVIVLGLVLYGMTFVMAWSSTEEYRRNIDRPLTSESQIIKNSLKAPG